MFFNVHADLKQYPRYFKDSILNTNPDFDYGPFTNLEKMVTVQNVTVTSFSFIFKEQGVYVFENAATATITVIGVVD